MPYDDLSDEARNVYDLKIIQAVRASAKMSVDLSHGRVDKAAMWVDEIVSLAFRVGADFDIDPLDFVSDVETELPASFVQYVPELKDNVIFTVDLDVVRDFIIRRMRRNHPSTREDGK